MATIGAIGCHYERKPELTLSDTHTPSHSGACVVLCVTQCTTISTLLTGGPLSYSYMFWPFSLDIRCRISLELIHSATVLQTQLSVDLALHVCLYHSISHIGLMTKCLHILKRCIFQLKVVQDNNDNNITFTVIFFFAHRLMF